MTKKFASDIDIDLANRDHLMSLIEHTPATIGSGADARRHGSGIYVTDIPYDPRNHMAAIEHHDAEKRGYVKLDLLNVNIYNQIHSEAHLYEMMRDPDWSRLKDRRFTENIIHIGKHYDTLSRMPEPIDSIARMAMFLAVIRPGKRHLIGKAWQEVSETIWEPSEDGFVFKCSHSIAYAHLVVVSMNLQSLQIKASASQE